MSGSSATDGMPESYEQYLVSGSSVIDGIPESYRQNLVEAAEAGHDGRMEC
jgi:hypothetical protein